MANLWFRLLVTAALVAAVPAALEASSPLCQTWGDCLAQAEAKLSETHEQARRELLQAACDQGQTQACNQAKLRRNQRRGGEASATEEKKSAVEVFTQACEQGNAKACFLVGNLAREQQDWDQAKRLLAKSCTGNYWEGCMGLGGVLVELGQKKLALPNFQKSCAQGIEIACDISDMLEKELQ